MEFIFETRAEASTAAAHQIAKRVSARLNGADEASLVVSGGTSPVACFDELGETALRWQDVHVLLSDERWVPPTSEHSNEALVRSNLLQKYAAAAKMMSYYDADTDIESRCVEIGEQLRQRPFPFACVLLGMGEDGHFASLFPDAGNLQQGLDTDSQTLCVAVDTAASEHRRVSLTLAALSRSDEIVLLMFGDKKRDVLEQAKGQGSSLPVAKLIRQKRTPVNVYWAP